MINYYKSEYQPPFRGPKKKASFWDNFRRSKTTKPAVPEIILTPRRTPDLTTNPFSSRGYATSRKTRANRLQLTLIILVALAITWIGFLIYTPYFKITKVTYLGLNLIKKEEIAARVTEVMRGSIIVPKDNYFVVRVSAISKIIQENFSLKSIKVTKQFPSSLVIDLEEKNSAIIYDNGLGYWLLDREGTIIKSLGLAGNPETNLATTTELELSTAPAGDPYATGATSSVKKVITTPLKTHIPEYRKLKNEFGAYPIVYDTRNLSVTSSSTEIFPEYFIAFSAQLPEELEKKGIVTKYMSTIHPLAGLEIYSDQPWVAKFQPEQDLSVQLKNLYTVLGKNKIKEYIDLRFGNRVYWK
ncbi:MAG: FtsQ-type POTRA domain-containing protein [bacterium]|nr:FtsQ-type POTRA domain-containing protein [bacterium]